MSRHEDFTQDQIRQADSVDIIGLLQSLGEEIIRDNREYRWKRHDSLTINPDKNVWFQHSTQKHGGTVRFLMTFSDDLGLDCSTFPKAMKYLIGESLPDIPVRHKQPLPAQQDRDFRLTERNSTTDHVVHYLQNVRKISPEIIAHFITAGDVYEESYCGHYNCVFVGRDAAGKPVTATRRATVGGFRKDFPGSNKHFGFSHITDSTDAYVFEAAIDLLSFATLFPKVMNSNLLAQGGCTNYKCLLQFLTDHPNIRRVFLGFDNDTAGQTACDHLEQFLPAALTVGRVVPREGDWNDILRTGESLKGLYTVRMRP